jgi:hypothetical protein
MPQTFGPNGTASAKPLRFPLTNGCLLDGLADDPAVASRSIRRAPLDEHRMRTKWPTMFNPSTHVGMIKLAVITAEVILGRSVRRHRLSKADAD